MASTYENDLRLEEMATGENSGSWGTKTNTNLELVADAFSYGTEIIANADTAITIADGAADAARSLALKITSSEDLTTTRVVTLGPNTTSKVWIIENSTSGGQTLTISAGSGSNITLLNGQTKIIATDGIGAGSNVVELTQDLAIADLFIDDDLSLQSDGGILKIGADADLQVTHSGSAGTITNATGDLTLDVAGDIILDADGKQIIFADGGAQFGQISTNSTPADMAIKSLISDEDIVFQGIDNGTGITALTLDMSEAGRATFNAGLLSNDTNDIRKAQITSQYDTSSFLRLHPSATTNSGGYTNMFFGTSTDNNYGVAIGGLRAGTDNTPSFRIRTHNDSTTGVDVLTINNSGVSTFRSGAIFNENGDDADFRVESDGNANMLFVDAGNNRVGIGTNAPDTTFQVNGTTIKQLGATADFTMDATNDGSGSHVGTLNVNTNSARGSHIALTDNDGRQFGIKRDYSGGSGITSASIYADDATNEYEVMTFSTTGVVINNESADMDFRVKVPGQDYMFWVDAGNDKIGINTSAVTPTTVNLDGGLILGTGWADSWSSESYYVKSNWLSNLIENGYGGDINAGIDLGSASTQSGNYNNTHRWRIQTSGVFSTKLQFVAMQTASDTYNPANVVEDVAMEITGGGNLYTYASAVFNDDGTDNDFRVESLDYESMFFVDGSANKIGINNNSPDSMITLKNTGTNMRSLRVYSSGSAAVIDLGVGTGQTNGNDAYLALRNQNATDVITLSTDGVTVFNDNGDATNDFRVESNSNTNMLLVDAENDCVNVGSSNPVNTVFNIGNAKDFTNDYLGTIVDALTADFSGQQNSNSCFVLIGSGRYAAYGGTDTGIVFQPSGANNGYYPRMLQTCHRGNNATSEARMRWYKLKQDGSTEVGFYEMNGTGFVPLIDDTYDLGASGNRWDDVYATNGTINTSDASLKEQVTDLSAAELQAATACKALIKKYKWISSVAEKGDDARWHIGVIAQDVQQAFTDAGLNAEDYGLFIRERWWTFTYNGREESTIKVEEIHVPMEEATEHTRLGVRYNELLAFIIAAL